MNKNCLNLTLFFFFILLSSSVYKNAFGKDNYIVTIVNKIPITKFDIINRAKLILLSIEKDVNFKNLGSYYNQSLKTLINEKIIFSAGNKINKDLSSLVSKQANQLLLNEFENSITKLKHFIEKYSIPKSALLEKHKAQLIWGIVLKNKYKSQFQKIDKNVSKTLEINKKKQSEDLYDIAEIVIDKNNNSKLLEKIKFALRDGIRFSEIAKQVSISSSSKFGGKIGWKSFDKLPEFIKRQKKIVNEGDIYSFIEKEKIKLIKILVKRKGGKLSKKENNITLAQVKFPINFQKKNIAYSKVKKNLNYLFSKNKNCEVLNSFPKANNKDINLKIIRSRIADLNPKIQNVLRNVDFFSVSQPIFYGNNGYTFIKCKIEKAKLDKIDYKKIKNSTMNKYFLIYSEKLLKRLNKEANIKIIEKIK